MQTKPQGRELVNSGVDAELSFDRRTRLLAAGKLREARAGTPFPPLLLFRKPEIIPK